MTTEIVYLTCAKCKAEKSESAFHVNNRNKSGRQPRCKCCLSRRTNELKRYRTEKKCWKCGETKHVGQFNKNRSKEDGMATECRECNRKIMREYSQRPGAKEKANARSQSHYINGRGRSLYLERTYGITDIDYDAMKKKQGGLCLLCEKKKKLVVDHCHETGRVRGLLCIACNLALGKLGDTQLSLQKAVDYLGE